jgi:hypothetical protein
MVEIMPLILVCDVVYTNNSLIPFWDTAMLIGMLPPVLFVRALLNIVLPNEFGELQVKDQTF